MSESSQQPSPVTLPPSLPSAGGASDTVAGWEGLDPSQLERRGKGRSWVFVGAFMLYLLLAGLVVTALVVGAAAQGEEHAPSGEAQALRGAPIDPGVREKTGREARRYDPQEMLAEAEAQRGEGEPLAIGFDLLASFEVPDPWEPPGALDQHADGPPEIPETIVGLDEEAVAIVGYASTHHLAGEGRAREFVLFRTRAQCCFGALPLPHEFILCHVEDEKGLELQDGVPMRIEGVLEIAPEYDGDHLLGVYRLEARKATLVEPGGS